MARTYTGLDVQSEFDGRFQWKSRFIDVGGGVRQAVVDEGPRDARATFLLLHGNPTWGYLYRQFIPVLAKDFRVVVPDHVGFGRSDKPRDPQYYSLARHVENLETTLAALKVDNVVPVVQDWGGPIGMGWATRHPGKVSGVVVLNTWAFVKDPPMKLPWLFHKAVLGKGGWRRATQRNIFTEFFLARGGARKMPPAEIDAYRAPHPTPEDRIGIARFPQMVPETHDRGNPEWDTMATIEDALPTLAGKPALIVWSLGDPAFRKSFLDRWAGLFRDVDGPHLIPRKRARHFLQEDAPELVLAELERWAALKFSKPPVARPRTNGTKAAATARPKARAAKRRS